MAEKFSKFRPADTRQIKTKTKKNKFFLKCFKNICGLPLKSMGKKGILNCTTHKSSMIGAFQFQATLKLQNTLKFINKDG